MYAEIVGDFNKPGTGGSIEVIKEIISGSSPFCFGLSINIQLINVFKIPTVPVVEYHIDFYCKFAL